MKPNHQESLRVPGGQRVPDGIELRSGHPLALGCGGLPFEAQHHANTAPAGLVGIGRAADAVDDAGRAGLRDLKPGGE